MSKLFITVLGTGNYFDCNYCKDDKSYRTPFIQEALIKNLYLENDTDFDMKILLTEKAKEKNYKGKEYETKLEKILKKYNITPELIMIPEGKNEDELWEIFDKLSKTIDDSADKLDCDKSNLEISIDITHSLRNIPMQILVAMNYLTLFKENINVEGIYYGAFELGETVIDDKIFNDKSILDKLISKYNTYHEILDILNTSNHNDNLDINSLLRCNLDAKILNNLKSANSVDDLDKDTVNTVLEKFRDYTGCTITNAPICNLNTYYDLMQWTNAINSFIKCGNTKEIQKISSEKKLHAIKHGTDKDKKDMILINKTVDSLNNFTNCINTCRGMYGDKASKSLNSIKASSNLLYNNLQSLDENISIKPLKKLFKLVSEKIEPFVDKDSLQIGLATVKWCLEYNLYQQGYTALDETIKTLLCVKLNLTPKADSNEAENSYINREDIVNTILAASPTTRKVEDIKIPKSLISESNKQKYPDIDKFIYNCIRQLKETKEFYDFVQDIKNYRNDINHFGFNKNGAAKYTSLSKSLNQYYNQLIEFSKGEFPWAPNVENTTE